MFRVLIVDDDAASGELLSARLRFERVNKQAVFETEVTSTPEAARQAVQDTGQPFDVFLLDVDLHAEVDGIALMQELRQQSPDSDAIVFTGDAEAESGQRAVELGAYRYLAMPYDVRDLIWNLRTLEQHRRVRRERDWLRVLSEIADRTQSVGSVREVAHELVKGGQRLGFERARVWRVSADKTRLEGVCQAGNPELEPFADQSIEVNNSQYAQHSLATSDASFFMGAVFGPLDVEKRMAGAFLPPKGEWAQIPLRSGGEVFALLSLDNAEQERVLSSEEKKLIQLFGQHAAVALSRAQIFELEQKKSRDLEVLNEIGKRITSRAAEDVDELLWEVRTQLAALVDVTNFIAVLYDDELQMLDFRLQVEQGRKRARHWATPDTGLIGRVVATNVAIYCPEGTSAYRKRHNIRLVGRKSKSWLGVPLRVANQAIGALAVQSYTKRNVFSQEDLQLLTKVADMVAGAIQSAWVREREQEAAQRLAVLQQFGAEFMQLAELSDAMLWHALCTAATADYALRFNRVAVFTRRSGSLDLTGRMGIGQFEARQAHRAWERDKKRKFSLKQYFTDLRSGDLSATPVEQAVTSMMLNVDFEGSAIKDVLASGKRQTVAPQFVESGLPSAFVEPFGITEYAVVPIRAGREVLGVLLVDNTQNLKPLSPSALEELENIAALAVLISENVRQRHIRDSVVRANYEIIGQAANRTLHDTLLEVCKAAQEVTTADNVVIYPLLSGKGQDLYDTRAVAATGLLEPLNAGSKVRQRGVTSYVLRSGIFPVPDVDRSEHKFNNKQIGEHKFLKREKVRAFIGNRIKDPVTDEALGAMYLNFRRPRSFTKRELEVAEMFVNLSATVIRTAHQAEAARSNLQVAETSNEASRRELITLRGILEESLDPDTDESKLIRSVLQGARDVLNKPDIETYLILRRWDQPAHQEDDPKEVGLLHFIDATGALITRPEPDVSYSSHGASLHAGAGPQVTEIQETASSLPSHGAAHTVHATLGVPVPSGRKVIGEIRAGSSSLAALDESDAARLDRLAKVTALALDNVRRQAHLRILLEAAQAMTTPTSLEETFEAINATARAISPNVSRVTIWHRDLMSEDTWLDAQFEAAGMKIGRQRRLPPEGGVRSILRRGEPLWANDAASEPLLGEQFRTRHGVKSCAALPLLVGAEGVGVIFLNYGQPHEFSNEERVLYRLLAEIAGASLRRAALLQLANQERERLKHSLEITAAVGSTLDLHRTLEIILAKLKELFPSASPCVLLFNEEELALEITPASQQYYKVDNPEFIEHSRLRLDGKGLSAKVARRALATGEPVLENVVDVGHVGDEYLPFVLASRSQLSAALMSDRMLLGVLMLESDTPEAFTTDDELLLKGVAQQISLAIDRANQSELLRFKATVTSRTAWAAEIAHDINREIGYIRNRTYWIGREPSATAQIKHWAEEIDSSAELLAGTVRNDMSSELHKPQSFELAPTIDRWLTEIVRSRQAEVGVVFEHDCAGLMVAINAQVLRRAVNHILRNAVEAMKRKGRINCSLRKVENQKVEILIADTGPGIPEEIRSRLGREPVTTKGDQHGGYGMILVRSVVEDVGGKIRVLTPRDHQGAVFSILLPVVVDTSSESE